MGLSMVAVAVAGLAGGAVLGAAAAAMMLRRAAAAARYDAEHDALTGLANRRAFYGRAARILADSRSGRRLVLAVVDVDGQKQVNDTLGHGTGDLVLQVLAGRLREAAGADGLVARLGGDEFSAIVGLVNGRAAYDVGRALHAACAAPVDLDRIVVHVSASVGVVTADGPDELAVLLGRADHAMYRAKIGRLGAAVYDPALDGRTTPIPGSPSAARTRDLPTGNPARRQAVET